MSTSSPPKASSVRETGRRNQRIDGYLMWIVPLWVAAGRMLLGSRGWLALFTVPFGLFLFCFLFAIHTVRDIDAPRREKVMAPIDTACMTVVYVSAFLFGLMVQDGGNTPVRYSDFQVIFHAKSAWWNSFDSQASLGLLTVVVLATLATLVLTISMSYRSHRKVVAARRASGKPAS